MKNLFRQPLLHFLLLGLVVFIVYGYSKRDEEDAGSRIITVDRESLLTFLQYRAAAFNEDFYNRQLDAMSDEQRQQLINDYIREEALYREALALGLDDNDYVIKRRLVQKLEFLTQGFLPAATVSDQEAADYYTLHSADYRIQPHLTFTHVFIDYELHEREAVLSLSQSLLQQLNSAHVAFDESVQYGDRFPYHTNYVERDIDYVASHFGRSMAEAVFALEPGTGTWQGPFESGYGLHLVLLAGKSAERVPALDEIREQVYEDAASARLQQLTEEAVRDIISTYTVRVSLQPHNDR